MLVGVAFLSAGLAVVAASSTPAGLRIDLAAAPTSLPAPFISLDAATGTPPNVTLQWQLPVGAAQTAYSVAVSASNGTTVWASGVVQSTSQLVYFPRVAVSPESRYSWTVTVRAADGTWGAPATEPFVTSASPDTWAATAPIWASPCGWNGSSAPPQFARFAASPSIPVAAAGPALDIALIFATGAPPSYNDKITKLLGGYALYLNGTRVGVGPGRNACGPISVGGSCQLTQPFDGYDVTTAVRTAAGSRLDVLIEAFSLPQPQYGIAPAVQAALVLRWKNGSATVFGASAAPGGGWAAIDGDALRQPSGNKGDPGWYSQPREDLNMECLVEPPPELLVGAIGVPVAPAATAGGCCSWGAPVPAPLAWANGTIPLAAKSTQPQQITAGVAPATITQLGPGWFVADLGAEVQGGVEFAYLPSASVLPNGLPASRILVQLGEELAANGSAMWQTRSRNLFQDAWTFPAFSAAHPAPPAQLRAAHHEYCEFRFLEIVISDAETGVALDVPPTAFALSVWTVHYPYADTDAATVTTQSPELDAVWRFCAYTVKATTLDVYADSNTRQRSTDCMADDTTAMLGQYASSAELALQRLVASQIMAMGPAGYTKASWADWTILPALNIINDALMTGDLESLARPLLADILSTHLYLDLVDPATGLVHNGEAIDALVDWPQTYNDSMVQSPWNAVVQAWVYASWVATAPVASALGQADVAANLTASAATLKASFNTHFFNGSAICDGLCANTPHTAAHSSFYALAFGLVDDANLPAVAAYLRSRVLADPLGAPCGPYPAQFLVQALYADTADHGRAAYALLTSSAVHSWTSMMEVRMVPSWKYYDIEGRVVHSWASMMETWSATTTMEAWQPSEKPNLSFSHVWASSPAFLVPRYFFGLAPAAPGWAAATLRPQPGPVLSGAATLPTVRGPVAVSFTQTAAGPGGCFTLRVAVPGGMALTAYVPLWGSPVANVTVTLDGARVPAPGVDGDYAFVGGVGSGEHSVTTC